MAVVGKQFLPSLGTNPDKFVQAEAAAIFAVFAIFTLATRLEVPLGLGNAWTENARVDKTEASGDRGVVHLVDNGDG